MQQQATVATEHIVALFVMEIAVILLAGRLLSEAMQRIGQPAVIGQLLAGIVIGPTVLGALTPSLYHLLYAGGAEQERMIDVTRCPLLLVTSQP